MTGNTQTIIKFDEFLSKTLTLALKKEFSPLIEAKAYILENGIRMATKSEVGGVVSHAMKYFKSEEIDLAKMESQMSYRAEAMLRLKNGQTSIPTLTLREEIAARWSFENPKSEKKWPRDSLLAAADEIAEMNGDWERISKALEELNMKEYTADELV